MSVARAQSSNCDSSWYLRVGFNLSTLDASSSATTRISDQRSLLAASVGSSEGTSGKRRERESGSGESHCGGLRDKEGWWREKEEVNDGNLASSIGPHP